MAKIIDYSFYDEKIYTNDSCSAKFSNLKHPFQRYRITNVLKLYTPNKKEKVLDFGCGWGTFCFALAPLCKHITGVDFSKGSIDFCQRELKKRKYGNVDFMCADVQKTGLNSASYDLIVTADLFEHLYPEQFQNALDEAQRLLKPKGKISIWIPSRGHFLEILKNHNIIMKKDEGHVNYKSMETVIGELKRRRFKILKSYYAESHLPVISKLEKWTLGFIPLMRRRIAILAEKG